MLVRCYVCNKLYWTDIDPLEDRCPNICPVCMDKPVKAVAEGSEAQKDIRKYLEAKEV